MVPYRPFQFHFMDDDYDKLYNGELRLGKIMNLFATIAIILACLGLFGLSSYTVQQRFKEIGIRKVLGASVSNIVLALSKDFIRLIIIAISVAFPIVWWATAKWLQGFSYRASISYSIYIICGFSVVLLAMITISFQAMKAALGNPVKSLRTE